MTAKELLNTAHRILSSRPWIVRAAVKVRNQANAVVSTHFSRLSGTYSETNGEYALVELLAPTAIEFVDVGGNTGDWAAHFLAYGGLGVAGLICEANASCVTMLRDRFAQARDILVVETAISDHSGSVTFYDSTINSELSSLSASNAGDGFEARSVQVLTLDELLRRHGWRHVSFLKIDTEGHDYFVLRGARELLAEKRVDVLQFECNYTWTAVGTTLRGAVNFLGTHGYSVRHLRPTGLFAVDFDFFGNEFGFGNWVAFHDGSRHLVEPLLRD